MAKALAATCVAGIVSVGGQPLTACTILSEGVADSEGVVFLDEDKAYYVAKTSPDLGTTLSTLSDALTQITTALTHAATALTAHDGIVGPVAAADIAAVLTAVTAITADQVQLDALAEAML